MKKVSVVESEKDGLRIFTGKTRVKTTLRGKEILKSEIEELLRR